MTEQIAQLENRWTITGDISMDNANAILEASNSLAISSNTVVDFAHVHELDTAAISLMLEWRRRAISNNQNLRFINFPASLNSLAQLYGVADLIN